MACVGKIEYMYLLCGSEPEWDYNISKRGNFLMIRIKDIRSSELVALGTEHIMR